MVRNKLENITSYTGLTGMLLHFTHIHTEWDLELNLLNQFFAGNVKLSKVLSIIISSSWSIPINNFNFCFSFMMSFWC